MSPTEFREALAALHWSQRGLADVLDCDDRLVRRWASGEGAIPPDIAEWLKDLMVSHTAAPPPSSWRRRRSDPPRKNEEADNASTDLDSLTNEDTLASDEDTKGPFFELMNFSWNWQNPDSLIVSGQLAVRRKRDKPAAIISFEVPVADPPPRNVFERPQDWAISLLRRTIRS